MSWKYWSNKKAGGFTYLDYSTYDLIISFRHLNPDYTGPAIELFRVSDSDIEGFNFSGGQLPIAAIESWAGGSSFDVNKFYSQGTDPNGEYSWNTARVRLGVSGVMNLSGGRPYVTNPGTACYNTGFSAPAIDQKGILTNDLVYSAVIKTQNDSSWDGLFAERGSSGNLFHCNIFSDTRANRFAYQRRANQSTNQTRTWNEDLQQNTKLIYSASFGEKPSTSDSDDFYFKNNVLKNNIVGVTDTILYPSGNSLQRFFLRSNLTTTGDVFQGEFYELCIKSYKDRPSTSRLGDERIELNDDQNAYYGIY